MKTNAMFRACCVVLTAVAAGGCNLLQQPPPPTLFQQMDTNHDGKLTRAEFDAGFANAMLTVYNLGQDGAITPAEWNDVERSGHGGGSFQRLDVNHDGKLTRAELSSGKERDAVVKAIFDRIDKNHDGVISVEEGRPSGLDRTPQERAQGVGL